MKKQYKLWMVIEPTGMPHAYTCSWQRKGAIENFTTNLRGEPWSEFANQGFTVVKVEVSYTFERAKAKR